MLSHLRMICANPAGASTDDGENLPIEYHIDTSPKLRWLLDRLEYIRKRGEKAIVFSEFREIQRLLQRAVRHRFDVLAAIVNGSTTVNPLDDQSRQRIIDHFQSVSGFNVIVLSTTAVGFGVNIQAANHVFHFTRPWNPAKEDQATDRAYRIGQTRAVHVYCPTVVAEGFESFEQRLDRLLMQKRDLSRDMLAGVQELSVEDFNGL
jgi:SNF2 family DNA or RNA helicase